jgi:hypothetical protein
LLSLVLPACLPACLLALQALPLLWPAFNGALFLQSLLLLAAAAVFFHFPAFCAGLSLLQRWLFVEGPSFAGGASFFYSSGPSMFGDRAGRSSLYYNSRSGQVPTTLLLSIAARVRGLAAAAALHEMAGVLILQIPYTERLGVLEGCYNTQLVSSFRLPSNDLVAAFTRTS